MSFKKRILVAEDDEDDFMLLSDAVKESYPDVIMEWVKNGEDLLFYLSQKEPPSLIFLDLNMPRKDGREVLKEMSVQPSVRRAPVVVLSNSGLPEDVAWSYRFGANTFIRKPSDYSSFVILVKKVLEYWFDIAKLPTST